MIACGQLPAGGFLPRFQDHKDDGGDADGDPPGHPGRKGLSEQKRPDKNGRERFKDAENCGLRRTDIA